MSADEEPCAEILAVPNAVLLVIGKSHRQTRNIWSRDFGLPGEKVLKLFIRMVDAGWDGFTVFFQLKLPLQLIDSYFFGIDLKIPKQELKSSCRQILKMLEPCLKVLVKFSVATRGGSLPL